MTSRFYKSPTGEPYRVLRIGTCKSCGAEASWIDGASPTCSMLCADRLQALRRLRAVDELFGRGDQQQWHRYERGDGRDVSQTVFAVWDSGTRSLFSGMENTALFTRPEAEEELARLMRDADVNSYEIAALLHAMESRG